MLWVTGTERPVNEETSARLSEQEHSPQKPTHTCSLSESERERERERARVREKTEEERKKARQKETKNDVVVLVGGCNQHPK